MQKWDRASREGPEGASFFSPFEIKSTALVPGSPGLQRAGFQSHPSVPSLG